MDNMTIFSVNNRIALNKVKLIIWDLDNTLWNGIISEQKVYLPEKNISLIKLFIDHGIVNSICSKNDYDKCKKHLSTAGLWDYFVFPSINWQAKGERIKQQIDDMRLRAENVLFIDDNLSNLYEAQYYCKNLMISTPEIIPDLDTQLRTLKKDIKHKRLKHYKLLEEKHIEKSNASSNIDFLRDCNIRVELHSDCFNNLDRIHEIVLRTNQLNFTKNRCSYNELVSLLNDKDTESGYVTAKDKFGDYGIIGFFAHKNNELVHFAFSCRTLGMGIEQYVYSLLDCPKLVIAGEVSGSIANGPKPDWINTSSTDKRSRAIHIKSKSEILFKGPCDMEQIISFIGEGLEYDTEFTYISNTGVEMGHYNHTDTIIGAKKYSEDQKSNFIKSLPFVDEGIFSTNLFNRNYNIILLSLAADSNLGVYLKKGTTDEYIVFVDYMFPITDKNNWEGYMSRKYFGAQMNISQEFLEYFSNEYESIGRIDEKRFYINLCYIRENIPDDTLLILYLPSEIPFLSNNAPAYEDRHTIHKNMNRIAKKLCGDYKNTQCIEVTKYIEGQNSFTNNINHLVKSVYYKVALELVDIINDHASCSLTVKGKTSLFRQTLKQRIKILLKRD